MPNVHNPPSASNASTTQAQSDNGWIQKGLRMRKKKLDIFMQQATVIQVLDTLDDLKKSQDIEKLEKICAEDLGPKQSAQCMSARFVDPQGKTLLVYFGNRIKKEQTIQVCSFLSGRNK